MTDAQAFTQANRAYFDKLASTYDTKPWQAKMSAQISAFLQQNVEMLVPVRAGGGEGTHDDGEDREREVKLLDYACGTGMVTKALQPHITSALGIDISPSMVSRYNSLFSSPPSSSSSSSLSKFKAIEADLLSQNTNDASPHQTTNDATNFDLAVVGLGFHHFHNPAHALAVLKERVKMGGIVGIVDFLPFPAAGHSHGGGHGHGHGHTHGDADHKHRHAEDKNNEAEAGNNAFPEEAQPTIKTHGFSEDDMVRLFGEAGLVDVGFVVMEGEVEMWVGEEQRRVVRRVFVARGVREV